MEDGRSRLIEARDRALQAVVTAPNSLEAEACWRLAKAHNRLAKGLERKPGDHGLPLPRGRGNRALGVEG